MMRDAKMRAAEPEDNDFLAGEDASEAQDKMRALVASMLATVEHAICQAKKRGLEAELRAIVIRNLPEFRAAPSPESVREDPLPPAGASRLGVLTVEQVSLLVDLLNCVQALDDHARRAKADSPSAKRDAACRDFLRALSADLKSGAVTVAASETRREA